MYNERENLVNVIELVKKAHTLDFEKEIIVVDDFSTDGSRELLKNIEGIKAIYSERNGGKGNAVRLGLSAASGDYILFQDADFEYSTDNYKDLLQEVLNGHNVVFGSRALKDNERNYLVSASDLVNSIFNLLFKTKITDVATCYKVFPASYVPSMLLIKENDFVFDVIQVTKVLLQGGEHIKEVPIDYTPRNYAQGKKMRIRHGMRIASYAIIEGVKHRVAGLLR